MRVAKRHDCGRFGMLTANEIAIRAGISPSSVWGRIRLGIEGEDLCKPYDPSECNRTGDIYTRELHADPGANVTIFVAMRLAMRFSHRVPTVDELRREFDMSRATAYRWRRAFLDAKGMAA